MCEVRRLQESTKTRVFVLFKKKATRPAIGDMAFEAKRRVVSIRTFWRDQIFREQSRAGIMIKRAVCKK